MKFVDLYHKRFKELLEQGPAVDPTLTVPLPGQPAVDPMQQQPATPAMPSTNAQPEEQKPLTPEGEVFLVRLLRKALFMNPGDLDEKALKDLPEVNERNASDVLNNIVSIMKKYSDTIDVETKTP